MAPVLSPPESYAIASFFTSGYNRYFRPFYESFRHHFFPGVPKTFFVFTDNPFIQGPDIVRIPVDGPGFYNALRFRYLREIGHRLEDFDHVLVANGNAVALQDIAPDVHGEDGIFLRPLFGSTTGLAHQPYHALCTDPASTAYVDVDEEDISVYWRGCLWGGRPERVVPMVTEIDRMLTADGIHRDELHVNRYFITHGDRSAVLDARYAWSGAWGFNPHFDIRIVMADKQGRYGELRGRAIPDDMLRRWANDVHSEGPVYLGPGRWPSAVFRTADAAGAQARVPGGSLAPKGAHHRLRRLFRDVLPPVIVRAVQRLRRVRAARRPADEETTPGA